jgi:hypothetical protein
MGFVRQSVERRRKLLRLGNIFLARSDVEVKPQNAEHNGRWHGYRTAEKNPKILPRRLTNSEREV